MEILERLEKRSQERYVSPQGRAIIYLGLGDKDAAMGALRSALGIVKGEGRE